MATTTTMLREDSILAWEKEDTRGTAPSTASAWREFGRVTTYPDLGPRHAITREPVVGAGQEAHELIREGRSYGAELGPYQVRDPLIIGHVFGRETARAEIGGTGFYEHTVAPTDLGQLPSMAVGQRDRRLDGSGVSEDIIYLETIIPRLSLRGEAPAEDGGSGRLLAAHALLPFDHQTSVVGSADPGAVTVNLGTNDPYRYHHASITYGGTVVSRIQEWEYTIDRGARPDYFWQDTNQRAPFEAPPQGAVHDYRATVRQDGDQYQSSKTLRELMRDGETFDVNMTFTRTAGRDLFKIELTDVLLQEARSDHPEKGPINIMASGPARAAVFKYTDVLNSAFFPT